MRSAGEVPQVLRALAKFALIFALIWMGLYEVQTRFPYLQTGSDVIFQTKTRIERTPHLFKKPDAIGVLLFGNSRSLAGFVPDVFDGAMAKNGQATESYNLGLPAYPYFVNRLRAILAAGNVPKYIMVTVPWPEDEPGADVFHFIQHDSQIMDELFPFHLLVRDLLISLTRGRGAFNYYEINRKIVERMLADRGYFFIYDSALFPDYKLPSNFRESYDTPTQIYQRQSTVRAREFRNMNQLLETYHVTCLLVPMYGRVGQMAPPPLDVRLAAELAPYPRIKLIGPDYVLFENRYFSDPSHLNPDGARLYTQYLAGLVASSIH
jgi:hypothetical protein